MEVRALTSGQRRHLKGLAHGDRVPVCQIGREGLTDSVQRSIDQALTNHELIKIQFIDRQNVDRHAAAGDTAERLGAQLVQVIGFKAVLYRRNPDRPRIQLPA